MSFKNFRIQLLNNLSVFSFLFVGLFVFFALGWMYFDSKIAVLLFGGFFSICTLFLIRMATSWQLKFDPPKKQTWKILGGIILSGILLRILWVGLVHPVQISDFKDYIEAARSWLSSGTYSYEVRGHTLYACRPPGYPMVLLAGMAIFGDFIWLPTLLNLIWFSLTAVACYRIVFLLSKNNLAALVSAALIAICPTLVQYTGLAASEPLSLALFTSTFWFFLEVDQRESQLSRVLFSCATGIVMGFGALVKPQVQMLPFLFFLFFLSSSKNRIAKLKTILISIVLMLATIAPWTIRNQLQFGRYLAISSNGGDVFYRANNPLATGDYTPFGEKSLDPYLGDELVWSQTGFEWGKEWIRSHPVDFAKLSVKKVARFLGDDASGTYWTLSRGHGNTGVIFKIFQVISNSFWIALWMLALAAVYKLRLSIFKSEYVSLLIWMSLFFVVAHSIFESHSRYHIPMIGFLCVLASLALVKPSIQSQYHSSKDLDS